MARQKFGEIGPVLALGVSGGYPSRERVVGRSYKWDSDGDRGRWIDETIRETDRTLLPVRLVDIRAGSISLERQVELDLSLNRGQFRPVTYSGGDIHFASLGNFPLGEGAIQDQIGETLDEAGKLIVMRGILRPRSHNNSPNKYALRVDQWGTAQDDWHKTDGPLHAAAGLVFRPGQMLAPTAPVEP